ncbi:DM13 domain-containing protein [Vibrio methylphosphonaticus]|uniref:DM13 domain-containing protein n=1 Tax=Vibrio methylphosphonaticus TaxID=2946866 RepID=UPI00202A96FD|nr:DM13 domain-containing protein [Vibrio methylphosphonaticus]MCL9777565.1 DM13 domain-containing protein [Vibrio methylphosphonaticus]
MKRVILLCSHLAALFSGFMLGIYLLPILIQPESPEIDENIYQSSQVALIGQFDKNRQDSDFLHWGEGKIALTQESVMFTGELAPGPDYKLYLSATYIETEDAFTANKSRMVKIGDIKTFDRFILPLPSGTNIEKYNTAIIWCETFGEFITSAALTPQAPSAQ